MHLKDSSYESLLNIANQTWACLDSGSSDSRGEGSALVSASFFRGERKLILVQQRRYFQLGSTVLGVKKMTDNSPYLYVTLSYVLGTHNLYLDLKRIRHSIENSEGMSAVERRSHGPMVVSRKRQCGD